MTPGFLLCFLFKKTLTPCPISHKCLQAKHYKSTEEMGPWVSEVLTISWKTSLYTSEITTRKFKKWLHWLAKSTDNGSTGVANHFLDWSKFFLHSPNVFFCVCVVLVLLICTLQSAMVCSVFWTLYWSDNWTLIKLILCDMQTFEPRFCQTTAVRTFILYILICWSYPYHIN